MASSQDNLESLKRAVYNRSGVGSAAREARDVHGIQLVHSERAAARLAALQLPKIGSLGEALSFTETSDHVGKLDGVDALHGVLLHLRSLRCHLSGHLQGGMVHRATNQTQGVRMRTCGLRHGHGLEERSESWVFTESSRMRVEPVLVGIVAHPIVEGA